MPSRFPTTGGAASRILRTFPGMTTHKEEQP